MGDGRRPAPPRASAEKEERKRREGEGGREEKKAKAKMNHGHGIQCDCYLEPLAAVLAWQGAHVDAEHILCMKMSDGLGGDG